MKTGIVITSWDGHLDTGKSTLIDCIRAAREAADYVICGYDIHKTFPPIEAILICDMFFIIGHNYGCECRICTKIVYRGRMFEAWQAREAILWISQKVKYILKIEGDTQIHKKNCVEHMVNNLLDDNDILLFPRGNKGNRFSSKQFATTIFLGKAPTLNSIYTKLKEERKILLEIQFSKVIHELEEKGELTYKTLKMKWIRNLITDNK